MNNEPQEKNEGATLARQAYDRIYGPGFNPAGFAMFEKGFLAARPTAPEPDQQGGELELLLLDAKMLANDDNYMDPAFNPAERGSAMVQRIKAMLATPLPVERSEREQRLEEALGKIYHCYLKYLLPENRNALVAVQYTVKDLCEIAQKALTPPGSAPKQEGENQV